MCESRSLRTNNTYSRLKWFSVNFTARGEKENTLDPAPGIHLSAMAGGSTLQSMLAVQLHAPCFMLGEKGPDTCPMGSEIQKAGGIPEGHRSTDS